jgi:hypothetical protein
VTGPVERIDDSTGAATTRDADPTEGEGGEHGVSAVGDVEEVLSAEELESYADMEHVVADGPELRP